MKENFEKAFKIVCELEGFVSNLKEDHGGLTIFGISSTYHPDEVKKMKELVEQNRMSEALDIAKKVYKQHYWDKNKCDDLPDKLDIFLFDTSVNMNVKDVQNMRNETDRVLKKYKDKLSGIKQEEIINIALIELSLKRILLYTIKMKFNLFGRGWINRVINLLRKIEVLKWD